MKILVNLNEKYNITMLLVTHDENLCNLSHRVVRMSDGKILST